MKRVAEREGAPAIQEVQTEALHPFSRALPPFSPLGPETLAMLLSLARGGAPAEPIVLHYAIVVQFWLVFFGPEASTELAQAGREGFYRLLCALATGEASSPPSQAELLRLSVAIERRPNGKQRPGLIPQWREALKGRDLRALPKEQATRQLLCRWRDRPFTFEFGTSGGGGGGSDDPGGGGSGM